MKVHSIQRRDEWVIIHFFFQQKTFPTSVRNKYGDNRIMINMCKLLSINRNMRKDIKLRILQNRRSGTVSGMKCKHTVFPMWFCEKPLNECFRKSAQKISEDGVFHSINLHLYMRKKVKQNSIMLEMIVVVKGRNRQRELSGLVVGISSQTCDSLFGSPHWCGQFRQDLSHFDLLIFLVIDTCATCQSAGTE